MPADLPRHAACGLLLAVLVVASTAVAAPPPGHPSPAQTRDLLLPDRPQRAEELPHQGKVASTTDANDFTYLEVIRDGKREWIAAPRMAVKVGSAIRYEDGATMHDFYSKLLKRTFPSIMFVGQVLVVAEP